MVERQTRRPRTGEARFTAYLEAIAAVLGDVRRAASARAYCTGLLLPGERKSVEPMAARIEPARVQARHQSMHHVVAKAEWDDAALLRAGSMPIINAMSVAGLVSLPGMMTGQILAGAEPVGKRSASPAFRCG